MRNTTVQVIFLSVLNAWVVTRVQSNIPENCEFKNKFNKFVLEHEAVRVPYYDGLMKEEHGFNFTWYKNKIHALSSSEENRMHYHYGFLFFLPVLFNDSAIYTCVRRTSSECIYIDINVTVFTGPLHDYVLYNTVTSPSRILCPEMYENASVVSWYKNLQILPNTSYTHLYISNLNPSDSGIYTCQCTWKHHGKVFNFSRSRKFEVQAPSSANIAPVIRYPTNNTITAALGSSINIDCTAFFGLNVTDVCIVWWEANDTSLRWLSGYQQRQNHTTNNHIIYNVTLTITSVSLRDYYTVFKCVAMNSKKWDKRFIFIQPSVTSYKHFGIYLFVLIFFLLTTLGIKFFIIDILLIFRKLYKPHSSLKDGKIYDAYVIYPRESLQMSSGAKICHFVYTVLPNILERKCGYKLFIYGRDDVPGEDRAEIIEKNIKLSRRLILLLTPGPLSDEIPEEAYDTQVGLYRALVQEEMKVIVIELEKFDDYMHLPETLHHIIQKRKSLKWNGNESATSRFWKHVRYMMPRCTSSSRVK